MDPVPEHHEDSSYPSSMLETKVRFPLDGPMELLFPPEMLAKFDLDLFAKTFSVQGKSFNTPYKLYYQVMAKLQNDIRDLIAQGRTEGWSNILKMKTFEAVLNEMTADTSILQTTLDIFQEAHKLLVSQRYTSPPRVTYEQMSLQSTKFEQRLRMLRSQLVVRRCQESEIALQVVYKIVHDKRTSSYPIMMAGKSYIDLLVSEHRHPARAIIDIFRSRNEWEDRQFEPDVYRAYRNPDEAALQCCITGTRYDVVIVPILAPELGDDNARYLFGGLPGPGHPGGHLKSAQNGLPMRKDLAGFFQEGTLTLVPTRTSARATGDSQGSVPVGGEWKVAILSERLNRRVHFLPFQRFWVRGPPSWSPESDLDGKILKDNVLKFHTDFRPDPRYLYFAHLVKIMKLQRYSAPGLWKKLPSSLKLKRWKIPSRLFLNLSALKGVAMRLGHVHDEEAHELMGLFKNSIRWRKNIADTSLISTPRGGAETLSNIVYLGVLNRGVEEERTEWLQELGEMMAAYV